MPGPLLVTVRVKPPSPPASTRVLSKDFVRERSAGDPSDAVASLFPDGGPEITDTTVKDGAAEPGLVMRTWEMSPLALSVKPMLPLPYVHAPPAAYEANLGG